MLEAGTDVGMHRSPQGAIVAGAEAAPIPILSIKIREINNYIRHTLFDREPLILTIKILK